MLPEFPLVFNSDKIELEFEDGNCACIATITDDAHSNIGSTEDEDGGSLFINFQSWDERDGLRNHPVHKFIAGKKLRITIEVLDENLCS